MGYQIEKYSDMKEALQMISQFSYGLLYKYSELVLCKAEDFESLDFSECMEARFFGEKGELHLNFQDETAVKITDDDQEGSAIMRTYELGNHYWQYGKKLIVKQYTAEDEDGQTYIALTRLAGIE